MNKEIRTGEWVKVSIVSRSRLDRMRMETDLFSSSRDLGSLFPIRAPRSLNFSSFLLSLRTFYSLDNPSFDMAAGTSVLFIGLARYCRPLSCSSGTRLSITSSSLILCEIGDPETFDQSIIVRRIARARPSHDRRRCSLSSGECIAEADYFSTASIPVDRQI